jgi:GDPmannose 4,6-dehydratase
MTRALITGITGQDGSYLAEFLLEKGYEVHGLVRRSSAFNTPRIDPIREKLTLHYGDVTDSASLRAALEKAKPTEIYHLAAQSHVRVSFEMPEHTSEVTGLGTLRILEATKSVCPSAKFYQASSSEMFGPADPPQNEKTPLFARSPYAASKIFAHQVARHYREAHGMFVACGILFNHESPRRGENFVTRKITRAVGRILAGLQDTLELGNLSAQRDWGYAPEYVQGMWLMLQHDEPDDFVLATGETHTVDEFLHAAFAYADLTCQGVLFDASRHLRPTEVDVLCGDARKAYQKLGWTAKTRFSDLVALMTRADILFAKQEKAVRELNGFSK